MKRNDNFILRDISGKYVLIPFGEQALDFNGIITLNDTAKFLWEICAEETNQEKLKLALIAEYEIDGETADKAVECFIKLTKDAGCLYG